MDPMANIERQRELAQEIVLGASPLDDLAVQLAEHVLALDEWRTKGGFDPYMKERRENDPNYRR